MTFLFYYWRLHKLQELYYYALPCGVPCMYSSTNQFSYAAAAFSQKSDLFSILFLYGSLESGCVAENLNFYFSKQLMTFGNKFNLVELLT